MKIIKQITLGALAFAASSIMAQQGPEDFPELKFANIPGAPKLQKPFLVMGSTKPVMAEKHGLSGPALWDWNKDGKKDLLIGEFETTDKDAHGENGSTVRVYLNVGTNENPKFTDKWEYAKDSYGVPLEVNQWCCIGFTPQFVDLDADGRMDIITGQYHPGDVYWFRGTPYGFAKGIPLKQEGNPWSSINSFDPRAKTADPIETFDYWVYSSANMGDMDGDGDLDLITGGSSIRISENIGTKKSPNFGRRKLALDIHGKPLKTRILNAASKAKYKKWGTKPSVSGSGKSQQHVVDWDGDGVLDILSTDEYLSSDYRAVTFFKGVKGKQGEMQRFQPGIALFEAKDGSSKPFPGSGQRVYVDDWNNDGVNDLIVGASIVTVDGKFHSKMSWEYEGDLGIPAAGKDYGRVPQQFVIPKFEDYIKSSTWLKGRPKAEQQKMYKQQMDYIKSGLNKLKKKGIPEATRMLHKGYIYVFLGKK